jgi:hypothetical protein
MNSLNYNDNIIENQSSELTKHEDAAYLKRNSHLQEKKKLNTLLRQESLCC